MIYLIYFIWFRKILILVRFYFIEEFEMLIIRIFEKVI